MRSFNPNCVLDWNTLHTEQGCRNNFQSGVGWLLKLDIRSGNNSEIRYVMKKVKGRVPLPSPFPSFDALAEIGLYRL